MKSKNLNLEIEYKIKVNGDSVNFEQKNTTTCKVSQKDFYEAEAEFSVAVGFDLTAEQMLRVICSDIRTIQNLINGYTDSLARSVFCEVFAKFVLGDDRTWPVGGSSKKYTKKFFDDLNTAALKMGFQFGSW